MAAPSEEALRRALAERQAAVDAQAEAVHALKADLDAAVEALEALKIEAGAAARRLQQAVEAAAGRAAREEHRQAVVNTLERKLFYIPSFKIYDYGPPRCRIKANVLSVWRQHFVLEENMLEEEEEEEEESGDLDLLAGLTPGQSSSSEPPPLREQPGQATNQLQ